MLHRRFGRHFAFSIAFAVVIVICLADAHAIGKPQTVTPVAGRLRATIDPAIAKKLLALVPDHISERDVRDVLVHVPAPRILLFQGSIALVTMEPFAKFLIAMGYPEERIRNPHDGSHSWSSFADSEELAGTLAWYYENEGVRPMMIGHSQGGMLAIRVLYELAGAFNKSIPVWNPVTDNAEARTTIVDPINGDATPVVGLKMPYAAAIATGKLPRILLGQWTMLDKLRKIPDSVEEFTGFGMGWDLIAGEFAGGEPYRAIGSAAVRNVELPSAYSHIGLPQVDHLASNALTRAWIDAYAPGKSAAALDDAHVDTINLIHAADIWRSVKKHWCAEAQRLFDEPR
jgi:hypothetical protein